MATGRIPINGTAAIQSTIVDAKGDLIAATADNTVARLAVGANDSILVADSSEATGLKWATPAASGGMTLLHTLNTTSTSSFTVTGIDQTYKHLYITGTGVNRAAVASFRIYPQDVTTDFAVAFNWFSGNNQANVQSVVAMHPDNNNGYIAVGSPLAFAMTINNYANASLSKSFQFYGGYERTGAGRLGFNIIGTLNGANAVNKIEFSSDQAFNAGQILIFGVN